MAATLLPLNRIEPNPVWHVGTSKAELSLRVRSAGEEPSIPSLPIATTSRSSEEGSDWDAEDDVFIPHERWKCHLGWAGGGWRGMKLRATVAGLSRGHTIERCHFHLNTR